MNTLVLLFAAIFALSYGITEREYRIAFWKWQQDYGKVYKSFAEHNERFSVFRKNFDFVQSHDENAKGFSVALNAFADLTGEEFRAWANGMNITSRPNLSKVRSTVDTTALPATVDWRKKGAVTDVKNQQQCGSCWSFSTTGSVEGAYFLATGKLVSLSEQNLIDCSVDQGNQGCNGGLMDQAFSYIISNKGIDTEDSYPYTATGPNDCQFSRKNVGATIKSYKDVPQGDEKALQAAVAAQPVSVAIDASQQSFQFYSSGVYYEEACSSTELDHGVLAVGYGTESGAQYWLVKNSWGPDWGDEGFIKMARNKDNNCGIATAASYPIAK